MLTKLGHSCVVDVKDNIITIDTNPLGVQDLEVARIYKLVWPCCTLDPLTASMLGGCKVLYQVLFLLYWFDLFMYMYILKYIISYDSIRN